MSQKSEKSINNRQEKKTSKIQSKKSNIKAIDIYRKTKRGQRKLKRENYPKYVRGKGLHTIHEDKNDIGPSKATFLLNRK